MRFFDSPSKKYFPLGYSSDSAEALDELPFSESGLPFVETAGPPQPSGSVVTASAQSAFATESQRGTADGGGTANASFASISTLAAYLYQGYFVWDGEGGTVHWWASSPVSVNISGLTSAEQNLARLALADWSRVANISFTFTTGAAQITYSDAGSGVAQTNWHYDGSGHMTSASIDISSNWWPNDDVNSYMMQTYLHETGHAIGLGHQGPYNNTATYGVSNVYTNDTWQWSVMSYFDQTNYTGNSPLASYDFVVTPEMADIAAVQHLYGAPSSSGGLTYGFHSNAGTPFDFTQYSGTPAFTIYNTGYNNTLDASGYSNNQILDANPGDWSSIGGYTDNIGIYTGTNIDHLVGGSGNDTFILNNSLASTVTGGGGNDIFRASLFGWVSSAITDLSQGDTINFTDGNSSTFTYRWQGTSLSYGNSSTSDTMSLTNNPVGHLITSVDSSGGTDLILAHADPILNDFGGDGRSDVLWSSGGTLVEWQMNGLSESSSTVIGNDPNWSVVSVGQGDFNGDHQSDILQRNSSTGQVLEWDMNGTSVTAAGLIGGDLNWHIVGSGDFNGDGRTDLLWQHPTGALVEEQMNGLSGTDTVIGSDSTWSVVGTGDFNGDGKTDILQRNSANGQVLEWEMNGNSVIGAGLIGGDANWNVVGTGDFNGDGKTDILWRSLGGTLVEWEMNGLTPSATHVIGNDPNWTVVGTGDFTDNGFSDILQRNSSTGQVLEWQMNGFNVAAAGLIGGDQNWRVVSA